MIEKIKKGTKSPEKNEGDSFERKNPSPAVKAYLENKGMLSTKAEIEAFKIEQAKEAVYKKYPPEIKKTPNLDTKKGNTPVKKSEDNKIANFFRKTTAKIVATSILISSLFPNLAKAGTSEKITDKEKNKIENTSGKKVEAEIVKTAEERRIKFTNQLKTDKS